MLLQAANSIEEALAISRQMPAEPFVFMLNETLGHNYALAGDWKNAADSVRGALDEVTQ